MSGFLKLESEGHKIVISPVCNDIKPGAWRATGCMITPKETVLEGRPLYQICMDFLQSIEAGTIMILTL